eukprot:9155546-Heterocapsa_arctica.AAC.1
MEALRDRPIALPAPLLPGEVAVPAAATHPISLPVLRRREPTRANENAAEVPTSTQATDVVVVGW